ncbi:efflux RND transporter periplasmic adaptor subunit [Sulfuricurvum sp.]|uniref:efflux RND transporter periplasmic adaptor subunit n=1 Tax=Sulfuricurvum sp. TaxID=2025608 RepID=UPI0026130FCE|nr:efflux RND transporter periplasmic adaptor subunit [Sulfuricurvum sp.]MDD3596277.1 efflux RND transporter periplasmic adaptor subunit [Sulfuricurvum sp.]
MNKMTQYIIPINLVIAGAITFGGCSKPKAEHEVLPTPVYVSTIHQSGGMEERWLSATVGARFESDLSFRTGGKVVKRLVNVGDRVTRGQPLAELDGTDYGLATGIADAGYKAALIDATQADSDEGRFGRLAGDGAMGTADVERQKARADAAKTRVEQARQQLELAKNRNSYATLVAPYDGVVTSLRMEVGQVVAEGQSVISLAKDGEREVVVDLPEDMVSKAKQYSAKAQPWSDPKTSVSLHLRELSPIASIQGRMYRARYAPIPESRATMDRIPLGSTAQLQLSLPTSDEGVNVPLSALIKTNNTPGVWVVNSTGNTLSFVSVNVLSHGTDSVRVRGLNEGVRIVTVGAQKLDGAMKIRPIERTDGNLENRGTL